MPEKLRIPQVASALGVSETRVRQLDEALRPERCACGAAVYDPAVVAAVATERALRRAARGRP